MLPISEMVDANIFMMYFKSVVRKSAKASQVPGATKLDLFVTCLCSGWLSAFGQHFAVAIVMG